MLKNFLLSFIIILVLFVFHSCSHYHKPVEYVSAKNTFFAGTWHSSKDSNIDSDAASIFDDEKEGFRKLIISEIEKYPPIIKKLGLIFSENFMEEPMSQDMNVFTIVLSRATEIKHEYDVKDIGHFYKYFYDVTLSVVIVDPKTANIEYSRVLTMELPVPMEKPIDNNSKKENFKKTLELAIKSLLKKTDEEFKYNPEEKPDQYFQITHMDIKKPDAEILLPYENDLKQFLHDALIFRKQEKGKGLKNISFLPPKSHWDAQIWKEFRKKFASVTEETDMGYFGSKRSEHLIEQEKLLTITGLVIKTEKNLIKENKLEAYHAYMVFSMGAVVERDKDGKKVAVYPKKVDDKNKMAKGTGYKEFHEIKGITKDITKKVDPKSEEGMYFDSAQNALEELSKELIVLIEKSVKERSIKGGN